MPFPPGTRFGPYILEAPLGAGGMGEVYRARDTRLDRIVAVKVLAPALASEPHFRARFQNEARAISALDHPNICALYDVGDQDGTAFLVMQYLEGETLASRLVRGPLPLAETLRCAREIADALGKAHRSGIVHRDLKPGNVMLTKSGAKLLDFGLARAGGSGIAQAMASAVQTAAPDLTAQGTIVGTFQYMAPEQLEAKEADARSDIFAFGTVLYEMLTGRKAFEGKSQASIIAAILEHEPPPLATLQPLTPPGLDRLVRICLAKDPYARWQSAGDLARELAWMADAPRATPAGADARPSSRRGAGASTALTLAAGALLGLSIGYAVARWMPSQPRSSAVARSLITTSPAEQLRALPGDQTLASGHPSRPTFALSPDGQTLVFSGVQGTRQQLFVRPLAQLEATALPGTDGGMSPFFSPDGAWIGFWADGALKKIPLTGGAATTLCATSITFGASWGSTDVVVFSRDSGGLWKVPAGGGTPVAVSAPDTAAGEVSHRLPQLLPGDEAVMFTVTRRALPAWDDTQVVVQPLNGGPRNLLVEGAADARYVRTGHIVYMRRGTLMAAPIDVGQRRITGSSVAVVPDVMQSANMPNTTLDSGAGQFSVSASGTLAYVKGGVFIFPDRLLVWVDRNGRIEPLAAAPRAYNYPRLSPDGKRIAVSTQGDRNVWMYDVARGATSRIATEGRNMAPAWTPDGQRVTFGSSPGGQENLFWTLADGSGTPERLTTSAQIHRASSWSPDGRVLAFVAGDVISQNGRDIMFLEAGKERPFAASRFDELYPEFSPDGKWFAFTSNESGRSEVYVTPYPGPGPRVPVSARGGHSSAWTRSGRELVYLTPLGPNDAAPFAVTAVSFEPGSPPTIGPPQKLFETTMGLSATTRGYDVTRDGSRLLMVQPQPRDPLKPSEIVLVQNWFDELVGRAPAN